jgi:hypothetical protein
VETVPLDHDAARARFHLHLHITITIKNCNSSSPECIFRFWQQCCNVKDQIYGGDSNPGTSVLFISIKNQGPMLLLLLLLLLKNGDFLENKCYDPFFIK